MFEPIWRDAVCGLAGVTIYDKGANDILGRYCVAKTMRVASGRVLTKQKNYVQRPSAIRYAKRFLSERARKVGRAYVPGDGVNTWAYKPLEGGAA